MASVWPQAEAIEASCRLRQYPGDLCLRSLTTSSAIDAQALPPDLGGRDQWRSDDVKGLAGSSRITSSVRRSRILFKCCANGINLRTLTRGRLGPLVSISFLIERGLFRRSEPTASPPIG